MNQVTPSSGTTSDIASSKASKYLRIGSGFLAIVFVVVFAVIAWSHILFPYEIDWYEGIMLDHSVRVIDGKQIYAEPDVDFVASLYQPVFSYLSAGVMTVAGEGYFAGRIVSVVSVLCVTLMLGMWAYRLTKDKLAFLIAGGLFLAAYDVTGYAFSLARVDGLLLLWLVSAWFIVSDRVTTARVIGAGALTAIAFFTKQQAIFFIPGLVAWLLLHSQSKRIAATYLATVALLVTVGIVFLQSMTDGWYWFYVFDIPRAKSAGFGWVRTLTVIPAYLLRYWGVGVLTILVFLLTSGVKFLPELKSKRGLVWLFVLTTIVQAAMHRGDQMSYTNVYLPLAASLALAITVVALEGYRRHAIMFASALALQLVALLYDPRLEPNIIIGEQQYEAGENFLAALRAEDSNSVVATHGLVGRLAGKPMFANAQSMWDVLVTKSDAAQLLRSRLEKAYAEGRFSAIIRDSSVFAVNDPIPNYRLDTVLAGQQFGSRIGAALTVPKYIYRPIKRSEP